MKSALTAGLLAGLFLTASCEEMTPVTEKSIPSEA